MKTLFTLVTLAAVAFVYGLERMSTANLRVQIEALRLESSAVESVRREHERLRQLRPDVRELTTLQHDAAEVARLQQELEAREDAQRKATTATLTVGEWLPPRAWKNRGHATPAAAVESTLWAAAGGDVAKLKDLLLLDDGIRAQAEAIRARLPERSRALYASPEQLIAAFTTESIPLGDAQLVWHHQHSPDEAEVCVFLKNSNSNPANIQDPVQRTGPQNLVPPMAPTNRKTHAAYLSLRRTDDGWRIVVPERAVEKISKDLGVPR